MEVESKKKVFQIDSEVVKKQLKEPNYLIEYTDINKSNGKYCIVYFSSNNIYYPNTEKVFTKDIITKNKFEWYGLRVNKGSKHIFIRDIQKQWYLKGINNDLNSVEKIVDFLKKETMGYKVIMLGSSSGGYASSLFGSLLDVECIISFNGQFQVLDLLEKSSEAIDPIVFREKNNPKINKYFSIKSYLSNPQKINYFYSNKSNWDIRNQKHINDLGIPTISFNTSNHGIPFVKSALPFVLNASGDELKAMAGKVYNPLLFSIRKGGVFATFQVLYNKIKNELLNKIKFKK